MNLSAKLRLVAPSALSFLLACGSGPAPTPATPSTTTRPAPAAASDVLGPRPVPGAPAAFVPRAPKVSKQEQLAFWVDERHVVPEVSLAIVLPHGSASDPPERNGLAAFTARMLEQGAGSRNSVALAKAFESLGAQFSVDVYTDYTTLTLTVLEDKLDAAFALLADVLQKPRFLPADFTRERARWKDELAAADKDPRSLFERNVLPLHFGAGHPYGHPKSGDPAGAAKTTLADVRSFYADHYFAAGATLVAVGDVTQAGLSKLVSTHLGSWQKTVLVARPARAELGALPPCPPGQSPCQPALPCPPGQSPCQPSPSKPQTPRATADDKTVFLLDRPGAPQSVVGWIADGVKASDPMTPVLGRVNAVLGGSFSSRLNQDLREERGITYGASSRFSWHANGGLFSAIAAVVVDKTGEGMRALDDDIAKYAKDGPTEAESERSRLLSRSDLVESFEVGSHAVARLARNAGVGLPADIEGVSSLARDKASKTDLANLARKAFGGGARRFVVGPKEVVTPQLVAAGYRVEAYAAPAPAPAKK